MKMANASWVIIIDGQKRLPLTRVAAKVFGTLLSHIRQTIIQMTCLNLQVLYYLMQDLI